jgi:hypothetical protein
MNAFTNLFTGNVIPSETVGGLSVDERSSLLELLLSGELVIRSGQVSLPVDRKTGPRGPTAKVAPRLEACRTQLLDLVNQGLTVSSTDLLYISENRYVYTDIGVVVDQLLAEGAIVQTNKGRKFFWSLAGAETLPAELEVVLPEA